MNDLDLREQFERWAEPLRAAAVPPDVAFLVERVRRRRVRLARAATSALAVAGLVTAVAVIGPPRHTAGPPATGYGGPGPIPIGVPAALGLGATAMWGHARYPSPSGTPYELVYGTGNGSADLINASTGSTVVRIHPTASGATFTDVAVDPDDRLFVLAQQNGQDRTTFAELRVGGRTHQWARVMAGVSLPAGSQIYGMTVNPEGTRLALNTIAAGGVGPMHLLIYDLTAGAQLDNFSEAGGSVTLQRWAAAGNPTTAPGREPRAATTLAFSWQAPSRTAGNGLRTLDTSTAATPGSSLLTASVLDPAVRGWADGTFTADGSVAISSRRHRGAWQVTEYSAATGQLLHVITIGTAQAQSQSADYCGVLWAGVNGADLLTQCGTRQEEVVAGNTLIVRLARIVRASEVGWADSFAW
jgi:hypothetical protein